jgi:hypothetical protein
LKQLTVKQPNYFISLNLPETLQFWGILRLHENFLIESLQSVLDCLREGEIIWDRIFIEGGCCLTATLGIGRVLTSIIKLWSGRLRSGNQCFVIVKTADPV